MFVCYSHRNGVLDIATTDTDMRGDFAASIALGQAFVVDVATADVATLARIALADCPALARKGDGWIGAGTHPAQPYLEAMLRMHGVGTTYNVRDIRFGPHDNADRIILTFLSNASTWRGETARTVKARLKAMLK